MTLSKEQIKIAKQACKENGIDVKLVNKELGNGFWNDECGGTIEGYISYLLNVAPTHGNLIQKTFDRSLANYRSGKYGASSIR